MMRNGDSYDDELNELSEKAESGDAEAGEKLLRLFATLADDPENAHPILVRHVARCVASLLEDKEPRAAFCIQRSRGAPRSKEVAAQREAIVHEYCRARAEGMTHEDAKEHVVSALGVTDSRVQKAYESAPHISRMILIKLYTPRAERGAGQ